MQTSDKRDELGHRTQMQLSKVTHANQTQASGPPKPLFPGDIQRSLKRGGEGVALIKGVDEQISAFPV